MRRNRDGGVREISASYTVAGIRTGKIRKIPDVGFCLWIRYTIVIPFMLYISVYVVNPIRQIYRVPTHEWGNSPSWMAAKSSSLPQQ